MNGASAFHLSIFGMPRSCSTAPRRCAAVPAGVVDGSLHIAFGVTEPDAGTDTTKSTPGPSATPTAT